MKTIGLIGGMSWESTVGYYQIINRTVKEELGGLHSAKCILYSVDFQEIEECQARGDWDKSAIILSQAAQSLEKAGADFIVICTNTMHKVAGEIEKSISIPILHIAEVTARQLLQNGIARVALLGTRYTMEQDFYKSKLIQQNIEVLIPNEQDRAFVNDVIYHELCLGILSAESKAGFLKVVDKLTEQGAQGVILGCTEIGMLIQNGDTAAPLYDTTEIHAKSAVLYALEQ
ncbi:aspartate/glutamate racemase family protein [Hydrogenoanaerobacterium sp.]|uniref:aspartate/glutamate racemase family protein n=1 Tax=Hydrogenoanaerobacterium sp. TaxID=2953763 RepID=UPI002896ABDE|nr:aspartate/glutamate racemase family protein [Hydrogenoanaerobacterium sp.]